MMRSLLLLPALGGLGLLAAELRTDYARERALRIEATTHVELATTSFEMLRDGQPVDSRFGGGDSSFEVDRRLVQVDRVLEHADGAPTLVRRVFEAVVSDSSFVAGERSSDSHVEGPLAGVTLEVSVEDGEPVAEVVEGDEPRDGAVLEGHVPTLALDALLPDGPVEPGADWPLDHEAIVHALALDLESALFALPDEEDEDDAGEGRGRGGRGRGFGGGLGFLPHTEWSGKATLLAELEDVDGVSCRIVGLELEGEGSMPEPEPGSWGGRGRDRAFEPGARAALPFENRHEIRLEGRLCWSVDEARPVLLELEGKVLTESSFERSRGDSTMTMATTREGAFEHRVAIAAVAPEEAEDEE